MESLIHNTSVIHPSAIIGKNVSIAPFVIIGPGVCIGDNTEIGASVLIEAGTVVGQNCKISHGASIGGAPQILNFKDVPSTVDIGEGTVVREYVTIHRSGKENGITKVGRQCLLMAYVHIAHDCEIGNNVVIVNSTGLSGHVVVEDYAFISGMIGVHQFVRIGKYSMSGGGVMIRQNVLPYSLIGGPPPRLVSTNSVGLRRHNFSVGVRTSIKKAIKLILNPELSTSQAIAKIEEEIEMIDEIRYLVDFIKHSPRGIIKWEASDQRKSNDESN